MLLPKGLQLFYQNDKDWRLEEKVVIVKFLKDLAELQETGLLSVGYVKDAKFLISVKIFDNHRLEKMIMEVSDQAMHNYTMAIAIYTESIIMNVMYLRLILDNPQDDMLRD